jgi:hypothetical protein
VLNASSTTDCVGSSTISDASFVPSSSSEESEYGLLGENARFGLEVVVEPLVAAASLARFDDEGSRLSSK